MKTREQLDAEIAAFIAGRQQARGDDDGARRFANAPETFDTITTDRSSAAAHRWIGRCKRCGAKHQLNGHLAMAHKPAKHRHDQVVVTRDGVYVTADLGTNPTKVRVPCGDHHCALQRVFDDGRADSKRTTCGARCLNSTGPSCDCRCRGANHGSGL